MCKFKPLLTLATLSFSISLTFAQVVSIDPSINKDLVTLLNSNIKELRERLSSFNCDTVRIKIVDNKLFINTVCDWNNEIISTPELNILYRMGVKCFSTAYPHRIYSNIHLWLYAYYVRTSNPYLLSSLKAVTFKQKENRLSLFYEDGHGLLDEVFFLYNNKRYSAIGVSNSSAIFQIGELLDIRGNRTSNYYLWEWLESLRPVADIQRVIAEQKEKQREKEITSNIYDLQEISPSDYNQILDNQREKIEQYFKDHSYYTNSKQFPSFESLDKSEKKSERFTNSYDVYYTLQNRTTERKIDLISGTDKELTLFDYASIELPTTKIEGYEVNTKAIIKNLKVDYVRGITQVKIKNGQVYFIKDEPEHDLQQKIVDELKEESNGKYIVKYECSNIMEQDDVSIQKEKLPSTGKKILNVVGFIGGLALTVAVVILL